MDRRAATLAILDHLDSAKKSAEKIIDAPDEDSLHDFRVSLRRARSLYKAYRFWLKGSHPKRAARKLKKFMVATNEARDLESQLIWLKKHGAAKIASRWRDDLHRSYERVQTDAVPDFFPLFKKLKKQLRRLFDKRSSTKDDARMLKKVDEDYRAALTARMARAHKRFNDRSLHKARIAVKRYRYFLENTGCPDGPRLKRLEAWQSLLGEIHDLGLLQNRLEQNVRRKDAQALVRTINHRRHQLYRTLFRI